MKVRPIVHLTLLGLLLAGAAPLLAETAYIPVANRTVEGVKHETVLWISNLGGTTAEFATRFIPVNSDGTPPAEGALQKVPIPPGGTFYLRPLAPAGAFGVLELTGDPSLVAVARLLGSTPAGGESLGASVPVVTAKNLIAAKQVGVLQGLERTASGRRTTYGVLNLGDQPAECSASVFLASGAQVLQTVLLQVPAFGQLEFYDALKIIGLVGIEHVRIDTSCNQPFYPYAILTRLSTGEVEVVGPSQSPDLGATSPSPVDPPPPGVVRLSAPGVFHTPSPGNAVKRLTFEPPANLYKSLRAQLDVRLGPWAANNPSGVHNIFCIVLVAVNLDMFGYVNVRGPNSNSIFIRHGLNQTASQKARIEGSILLQPGSTYHFDYRFDTANRVIELIVSTASGAELIRMRGVPNVNHVRFDPGQTLVFDFGFQPGVNPNEPPTYGWDYQNLTIDLDPE